MTPQLRDELRQTRPFGSAEEEAYLGIQRSAALLSAEIRRFLKEEGLSEPQYNVLRILTGAGSAGLPSQEIGVRMVTPVPDVTRLVDRLEKSELVERHRESDDRRVVRVVATAAGKRLAKRLAPKLVETHNAQLGHLSPTELKTLSRLLGKTREPTHTG